MRLGYFKKNVISSEHCAVNFLQNLGLLNDFVQTSPCTRCGSEMKDYERIGRNGLSRPVFRCTKNGCQTTRSVRYGNRFFHSFYMSEEIKCRLRIVSILTLVMYFVRNESITQTHIQTKMSKNTVYKWFASCREICTKMLTMRPVMRGEEDNPIFIDTIWNVGKTNCRNTTNGPWIFGMKQKTDCRYYFIESRSAKTLMMAIKNNCEPGSVLCTENLSEYAQLANEGYQHRYFVPEDENQFPKSKFEKNFLKKKIKLIKCTNLTAQQSQSHLDHFCWRIWHQNDEDDLFVAFLKDIKKVLQL